MYLDRFIEEINTDDVKVDEVSILGIQVKYKNKMDNFYSLNEIVVRYKDSKIDYLNNKRKKFIKIDKKEVLSKLYDIGYIDGYNKFINNTLNLNKNNV